ncbi:MAG: 50S ribosomal protein L3 [Methylococcaceae bacterium]|nr:50S ribosomal protein L3 [Methylococcaceae bacterium]
MPIGLVGRKFGMTRVFTEEGVSIPVTVVQVESNRVTQVKSIEKDGYRAIQVTTGGKRVSRIGKPLTGHYAKAGVESGRGLWEFRLEDGEAENMTVGTNIELDRFEVGQFVDVRGTSIGKGFAGCVKRHNFRTQDSTHGNSLSHRAPGSIGQNQTPGRVFKGKKMAGHMGNVRKTIQNLSILRIDPARKLLLIKGAVPGAKGSDVIITPAIKKKARNKS